MGKQDEERIRNMILGLEPKESKISGTCEKSPDMLHSVVWLTTFDFQCKYCGRFG